MNRLTSIACAFLGFFGFVSLPSNAQFNLKTGYNISFLSDPGLDPVLATRNEMAGYTNPFPSLKWLHGFEVGLRYKVSTHALVLSYQNGYQRLRAEGVANGSDDSFTDKIRFSVQSIAAGYQVSGERMGMGLDLQRQWYNTKADLEWDNQEWKNRQAMMALKYYFMFIFPGSSAIDMAIQPYIIYPFQELNIQKIQDQLFDGDPVGSRRWIRYGLTIVFYNGGK